MSRPKKKPARPQTVQELQQEMQLKCEVWQQRLRLKDWHALVRLIPHKEFDDRGTRAESELRLHSKNMRINLLHPSDWTHETDLEADLVHELMHLHFLHVRDQEPGREHYNANEQSIELLTEAMLRAYRR